MRFIERSGLFLSLVALAILSSACAPQSSSVLYNTNLDSVERPADAQEQYGEYEVSKRDTTDGTKYVYEDELIRASFFVIDGFITTSVENLTEYSIQLNFGEGAIVLPSGSSDQLVTGNMSYADRNQAIQPVTVPSGASAETVLVPKSNVNFNSYSGLTVAPIISPSSVSGEDEAPTVEENIGKTFRLLLPIEIQDTVNEYTFAFEVLGARIVGIGEDGDITYGEVSSSP